MKKILLSTNIVLQIIGKIKEMTLRKVIYPKPFCRFPITRTYYYKLEVTFSIDHCKCNCKVLLSCYELYLNYYKLCDIYTLTQIIHQLNFRQVLRV